MLEKYFTLSELQELKEEQDLYKKCQKLVSRLFTGVTDKEGAPYIEHLLRVSNQLTNYDEKCAGLLHDVIEDIEGVTEDTLRGLGIPENVIEIVKLVTKDANLTYPERIDKIINSNNLGAIRLKYADMTDNMDKERLKHLDINTRTKLTNKYKEEIKKLEKRLQKR